jgi:crotonobetainyl-CoA:carnitine CoA-transferase CaiB-like acyl-CoA transferase
MALPLKGVRVLCSARYLPAGYCTQLLADAGADVILLEQAESVERINNPGVFNSVNRGKRSITLNLKSEPGQKICHSLVRKSDVFIDGFRPGTAAKLHMDYATLKTINPRLVYVCISGFGQNGPYRLKSSHDLTYQGIAGMLSTLFRADQQKFSPSMVGLGDITAGMISAFAILAALREVEKSGQGKFMDISMTDILFSLMNIWLKEDLTFAMPAHDYGYDIYRTKDKQFLSLSMVAEDHFWRNLCKVINRNDLANLSIAERSARSNELATILREVFMSRTRDEWVDLLTKADVPSGPVYLSSEEVFQDPQLQYRNMIIKSESNGSIVIGPPLKYPSDKDQYNSHVPALGENTRDVLSQLLAIPDEEIKRLHESGVI